MIPEQAMITFAKALLSPPDLYFQMMEAVLANREVVEGLRTFAIELASENANPLLVRLAGLAIETPDLPRNVSPSQPLDDTINRFLIFVNMLHQCSGDETTARAIREHMANRLYFVSLANFAAILAWARIDPEFLYVLCDDLQRLGPLQRFLYVATAH